MVLTMEQYLDKVYAAWIGKNIGGTFGGPYEGGREYLDVQGFSTEAGAPLPNDDLDLQMVWLHAVEKLGPRGISAATLGEMWMSFIPAHWHEYGNCQVNMKAGLAAPISGDYNNSWKNSNGAWIRTEVWACLAPAAPAIAAKYAIMDASVDHGVGEGTAAAAFVAAMESAAFVENNIRDLIEVGLCAIPETSRMYDSIRLLLSCYDKGMSPREARDAILERNSDIGNGWFEAPSNVTYAVLGLLYGEGDFKKSMIAAVNCGDDTDCTGATVGALLGIMGGTAAIPEDWRAYIGDNIISIAINPALFYPFRVLTCTDLAKRVAAQMPLMLQENGYRLATDKNGAPLICAPDNAAKEGGIYRTHVKRVAKSIADRPAYTTEHVFGPVMALARTLTAPEIGPNGEIEVEIVFENRYNIYGNLAHGLELSWMMPEGFTASADSPRRVTLPMHNPHDDARYVYRTTIKAGETVAAENRLVLEVKISGRPTIGYIPITLLG